jgi:hypothetical protein
MSQNEKPLPKPPSTPFGRKRAGELREEQEPLTADRMAAAMAEGKLEEFLKKEMPDNEHARKLANMMMGMSGMMPTGAGFTPDRPAAAAREGGAQPSSQQEVPAEVEKLVQGGDVKGLMDILRHEHLKRSPEAAVSDFPETVSSPDAMPSQPEGMPTIDKELIDAMIQIAKDNSVTVDWIILRAIKIYVEEYRKTGKL